MNLQAEFIERLRGWNTKITNMVGRKRTRAVAAASATDYADKAEQHQRKKQPSKKRKASDLQLTSDSETGASPRKPKVQKVDTSQDRDGYGGPYPQHFRPTPQETQTARDALAALHGDPKRAALGEEKFELAEQQANATAAAPKKESWQKSVLDSLVCTILSQNTTDVNSARAFAKLKEQFPEWEMVRTADSVDIEESIKSGGLAAIKTERIKVILNTLKSERGECSLEHLRQSTDDEIKSELERFKGVGKKTIACVLMFCLDRHEFPVDTHVWRITKAMGWVPAKATRDEAYAHLNARIPDHLKYDLHVLLVNHGKRCTRCAKNGKPRKASDGDCPLFGSKTVKEVLKEHFQDDQDSAVKQDLEDDHDSLVKQEQSVDDSEVKQESLVDNHVLAIKQDPDNEQETSIKQEVENTVKPEPVPEHSPQQHGGKDDGGLTKQKARSRSTRAQVKKADEVPA